MTLPLNRRSFLTALAAWAATPALALDPGPLDGSRPPRRPRPSPDWLIAQARLDGQVAFAALAPDGSLLQSRNANLPLPPASTLKIVTALYALDRLGSDHRFSTRVLLDGQTLILAGGGDPVLDTDALDDLAAATVAELGGRPVTRLVIWGGALPRIGQIAAGQAVHLPYNPSVSGMMLNFNRVHLDWRRGDAGYRMALTAQGRRVAPRAYSVGISAAERSSPLFTYDGAGEIERWSIAARAMGKAGMRWLPVRHPELYAGDVFQTLCRARGLALPKPEVTTISPAGTLLARRDSPALRDIMTGMLSYSTNLTAEAVGLAASGAGDLISSGSDMAAWLHGQGIDGAFTFADHSGLSPDSRIAPVTLARVLAGPGRAANLSAMLKPDPLGETLGREAKGVRVHAKTGTLNFVSNLSGYAGKMPFAIMTADLDRRAATEGQELPAGVSNWIMRSKRLQRELIAGLDE